ncbi:hypothetical protein [Synechocystis sp. PCC 7509]|uniref:hypothetical protein n=1 Tax=Synechocystis sp. PCC 7509 TaxID=927677 RepID=UPI0002ABB692|nr:hypothetical protein [Synechocystis sp. PCC 7509]
MNSSLNPSESNSAPNQPQTPMQAIEAQNPSSNPASTDTQLLNGQRLQPIPPPSEPMQYRAIGLVRGRYVASSDQFTQGTLSTTDETQISAVLLGRIISLIKNHIDLAQEHLWVVYPRTGQKEDNLHLQIVGVWEPEKLTLQQPESDKPSAETALELEVVDNYFSVRGEIVYQSTAEGHFIVKIRQATRTEADKPKYFKLKIFGDLATKAVGQFWDLQVQRQAEKLILSNGEAIAALTSKPVLRKKPYNNPSSSDTRRNFAPPQPVRKTNVAPPVKQPARSPAPKPIKRQNPQ